jgi:hypothetical protein
MTEADLAQLQTLLMRYEEAAQDQIAIRAVSHLLKLIDRDLSDPARAPKHHPALGAIQNGPKFTNPTSVAADGVYNPWAV